MFFRRNRRCACSRHLAEAAGSGHDQRRGSIDDPATALSTVMGSMPDQKGYHPGFLEASYLT